MAPTLIVVAAIISYWIYSNVTALFKNIVCAKRSGLPYAITPIYIYNPLWLVTHKLWLPILQRLPSTWTENWLPYLAPDWVWNLRFAPFENKGDVFLTVSPGNINIWLANAEAISQVSARREAFPKPLESYRILEIFGRNIITTEGNEWKQHRKITSPGFNEKNNVLVFRESCRQAQGMLRKWTKARSTTLKEVPMDTMRLTLHIISRIGFGVRLLWPEETPSEKESAQDGVYSSHEPPPGHSMSFEHALNTLLENLLWVLLTPKWILKRIPLNGARNAYESFLNWTQYMNELFILKVEEARDGNKVGGLDIMGSLVRSSYGDSATMKSLPEQARKEKPANPILSDSDILGNVFVMIVAGHETTANSIHFSLMELAINPRVQRLVQREVHSLLGDTPPETWDYELNINALLGGMIGAVLNEQLRLMPPIIAIPKTVTKSGDQDITLEGKKVTLPAGAFIALCTIGVHRNPKYWPTQPSKITGEANDLNDFRPERWLTKAAVGETQQVDSATECGDEDFGGYTGQDSSAKLFRPVRGSYLPFSEGARSCLGRRLAQVKIMAVLAVIFQNHSIELAVDEWATDAEIEKMDNEERKELYRKAQDKARKTLRSATSLITLKLHEGPGFIPVRVVRKGEERFVNIVD